MNPMAESSVDGSKNLKVIAGFALIYDLWNERSTPELHVLYEQPTVEAFRQVHSVLQSSDDYRDREAAIWLMLALNMPEPRVDLQDTVNELQEMEFIIRRLLSRSGEAWQADLNMWMDYLANAAIGLKDGFWLDAKMDLNRALSLATGRGIMGIPSTAGISHEISLLRNETRRLFLIVRDIPVRLNVPVERLDLVLNLQTLLMKAIALQMRRMEETSEALAQAVRDINQALRQAMREGEKESSVMEQLRLVSSRLETEVEEHAGQPGIPALNQLRDHVNAFVRNTFERL